MARIRKPTADELRLWRLAMRDVAPLKQPPEAAEAAEPPPAPEIRAIRATLAATAAKPPGIAPPPLPPIDPERIPGVDRRTADGLRRGRLSIEARLDLHGLTQAEAHDALTGFVLEGYRLGRRMLLVITGKGGYGGGEGILRRSVPRWLNEDPLRAKILAFTPAQPRDGGAGALYLLLKRRRD